MSLLIFAFSIGVSIGGVGGIFARFLFKNFMNNAKSFVQVPFLLLHTHFRLPPAKTFYKSQRVAKAEVDDSLAVDSIHRIITSKLII